MKTLGLLALFFTLSSPVAFAHNHEVKAEACSCSKECKENCEKGKSEKCECKTCDCKNTGHCHKE